MEFLLNVFYLSLLGFIIGKSSFFRLYPFSPKLSLSFFLLKVFAATALTWIYTHYYTDRSTADIYKYFDDSKIIFDTLFHSPVDFLKIITGIGDSNAFFDEQYYFKMRHWYREYDTNVYNDARTMIRLNAIFRIFSFGFFSVHNIFIAFLSFIGLTALYNAFVRFFEGKELLWAIIIFLTPSVLFWGSGVLKEGLLFFAFGLLLFHFMDILKHKRIGMKQIAILSMCIVLMLYLKIYMLIAIAPALLAYGVNTWKQDWLPAWTYMAFFGVFTAIGLHIHYVLPQYEILDILEHKQRDFIRLAIEMDSGSYLELTPLSIDFVSFLKNIPEALLNTLLRPFIWNISSPLIAIAAIENTMILSFILYAIVKSQRLSRAQQNTLFFFLSISLTLFVLIGWVTPVIGAIVRYKVPILPLWLGVFLLLLHPHQTPSFLRSRKKSK